MNHPSRGDRHSGTLGGKLANGAGARAVVVTASPAFASTTGGQHLLWMLSNLLARQYDVISKITFAVPNVPLHSRVAPFAGRTGLLETLLATTTLVSAGQMEVGSSQDYGAQNFAAVAADSLPDSAWAAIGNGWKMWAGPTGAMTRFLPISASPIGPYFAACVLASELFKSIRGYSHERRSVEPFGVSLRSHASLTSPDDVHDEDDEAIELPHMYLVGAGAVGQAFAATLLATPNVSAAFTIVDHDAVDDDLTNLNRYCLSFPEHQGHNKASILERYFSTAGFWAYGYPGTWAKYIQDADRKVSQAQRDAENGGRFEFIVSAVDTNDSRHDLQRMWPRFIFGGSTLGLSSTVQLYDLTTTFECLMCSNPPSPAWTIEGETERLSRLSGEDLRAEAQRVGADISLVEKHVREKRCGTLEEAEVQKFRLASAPTEFAVGFVSVATGVLLAARILAHFRSMRREDANAYRFSFESNKPRASVHRSCQTCECVDVGRKLHQKLWLV